MKSIADVFPHLTASQIDTAVSEDIDRQFSNKYFYILVDNWQHSGDQKAF